MSAPHRPTACLALADGTLFHGRGFGATGETMATLVFNTSMAGYQEILSDPASMGQIVVFTFPHVGNTGTTPEDDEGAGPGAAGLVVGAHPTAPSNWRATGTLDSWLAGSGRIGISGIDTRRLTRLIRDGSPLQAVLSHDPAGAFDTAALVARAATEAPSTEWKGTTPRDWDQTRWEWPGGIGRRKGSGPRVVVIDFGVRHDTLRALASLNCEVVVLPSTATAAEVMARKPAGMLLAGGPGDPAGPAQHALSTIRDLIGRGLPLAGLGIGHLLLGLALGARVIRLPHGHHGANHPVREVASGRVEIVTTNTDHALDGRSLPAGIAATHESLFDGSNYGLEMSGRPASSPVFSRQACAGHEPGTARERDLLSHLVRAAEGTARAG